MIGPAIVFIMSALFRTGTISIAASICSIILSKSASKSSFPKPAEIFGSYYILNYTENSYILDTVAQTANISHTAFISEYAQAFVILCEKSA